MEQKYIYMLVSQDKYELPLFVCDTRDELSDYVGISAKHISEIISHAKKKKQFCRYVRVELPRRKSKKKRSKQTVKPANRN